MSSVLASVARQRTSGARVEIGKGTVRSAARSDALGPPRGRTFNETPTDTINMPASLELPKSNNLLPFAFEEVLHAVHWGFNCGPGALCAVLGMTPNQIRPHLLDFETKGYTNPTLMRQVLTNLGVQFQQTYRSDVPGAFPLVNYGLVRIQCGGPWTRPGVPMAARYRQTHWVAARNLSAEIFDINAIESGGWLPFATWANELYPSVISECAPKSDGTWWATHAYEITHIPR